ncbi:MAG: hypothetical protein HRT68_08800 [Flavobacteriaceae bacterium]|nr:hypothetical protein [Flavobacteriaceae bacterium]
MASIRNLKKDANFVFGEVIEAVYVWQLANPSKDAKGSEAIIDQAISSFDTFMARINEKNIENNKSHFKAISKDLEAKGNELFEALNKL